jgi:hypothetical protein
LKRPSVRKFSHNAPSSCQRDSGLKFAIGALLMFDFTISAASAGGKMTGNFTVTMGQGVI